MKGKNDKLSYFITKRLQSLENSNDHWDKPDASVWDNAKKQMTPPKKDKDRVLPIWWFGLGLATLLLCSLFYNWHLTQLKNEMNEQLKEQSKTIALLEEQVGGILKNQEISNTKEVIVAEQTQHENKKLVQENREINKKLTEKQQQYQRLLNSYINVNAKVNRLERVQKEALSLNESASSKSFVGIDQTRELEIGERNAENKMTLFSLSINPFALQKDFLPSHLNSLNPIPAIIPQKKKRKQFEIGFNYGSSLLKLSSIIDLDKEKESLKKTNAISAPTYHLHIAYSLKKNWWIKTGIRYSNYYFSNKFQFKSQYDKSKELVKSDGTATNELPIQTNNGYFRTTQNIEIKLPDDNTLETGDWVFGEFEENQEVSVFQIPVSVEYRQRKNKLGWQIEAGALINRMNFLDTTIEGKIQSTQKEFPTEVINKTYDSATSKLFFGVQGGMGLHYEIYSGLLLRADVLYQYSAHSTNRNVQLGLSYQF